MAVVHSSGLAMMQRDDIPQFYKGNVYKNYDLVTVSSPYCRPFFHLGDADEASEDGAGVRKQLYGLLF